MSYEKVCRFLGYQPNPNKKITIKPKKDVPDTPPKNRSVAQIDAVHIDDTFGERTFYRNW